MSMPELIHLIHQRFKWPAPTQLEVRTQAVYLNIGYRRYLVFPSLEVRELVDRKVAETQFSRWVQERLQVSGEA